VGDLVRAVESATAEGYLVRARADVDTVEARAGFVVRRDAILASGAQVIIKAGGDGGVGGREESTVEGEAAVEGVL
jgi:hypothetical protein